ncbi:MAG: biotin--[acetyl-CoA-carboxylase] ligase, partial [Actinobacteria bacterium]|nr:biotin--[acetyl-CoA-carboxylase] ligase [Actinomycetota bacterium]
FLWALEERCRQPAGEVMVEYRARCSTIGKRVRVDLATEVVTGTAVSVDGQGRLVVECPGGRRTVAAGDVMHVR